MELEKNIQKTMICYNLNINFKNNKPKIINKIIKELNKEDSIEKLEYIKSKTHEKYFILFNTYYIIKANTLLQEIANKFIIDIIGMFYGNYNQIVNIKGKIPTNKWYIEADHTTYETIYVTINANSEEEAREKFEQGDYEESDISESYDSTTGDILEICQFNE